MKIYCLMALMLVGTWQVWAQPIGGKAMVIKPSLGSHTKSTAVDYLFTCDYYHMDSLGKLSDREEVRGKYTRGLPGGKVQWSDVTIGHGKSFNDPIVDLQPQTYMDGFTYDPNAGSGTFAPSFFAGWPDTMETKTLVWDTGMFELYAWRYLDKLKTGIPYTLQLPPTPFPGGGSFDNRHVVLTLIGNSTIHGKTCQLIQYEAFMNPLSFNTTQFTLSGVSTYWGMIWLDKATNRIELGTLREDVGGSVKVAMPQGTQNLSIHTLRVATFEKLPR